MLLCSCLIGGMKISTSKKNEEGENVVELCTVVNARSPLASVGLPRGSPSRSHSFASPESAHLSRQSQKLPPPHQPAATGPTHVRPPAAGACFFCVARRSRSCRPLCRLPILVVLRRLPPLASILPAPLSRAQVKHPGGQGSSHPLCCRTFPPPGDVESRHPGRRRG
jgi:hypothetical protein